MVTGRTGVLDLWDANSNLMKGATIFFILSYLTTALIAIVWTQALNPVLYAVLLTWPFFCIVWMLIVWLVFSLIAGLGYWIAVTFAGKTVEDSDDYTGRIRKIILFIPVIISSVLSVIAIFLEEIFGRSPPGTAAAADLLPSTG